MKYKILAIVFSALLAAAAATGAEAKPDLAILDFYLLERIPYDYLKDAVVPEGDDIFSAERLGMTIAMRELLHDMIEDSPVYELAALKDRKWLEDDIDLVFHYYVESEDPTAFFDRELLGRLAEDLRADALILGLIHNLKYENNPRKLSAKKARMKISYMVYNAADNAFDYVETFESDSDNTRIHAIPDKLPGGKYSEGIEKFATSEPGRVFMDTAGRFIKQGLEASVAEITDSEPTRAEQIANSAVSHRGRPGTADSESDVPQRPKTGGAPAGTSNVPQRPGRGTPPPPAPGRNSGPPAGGSGHNCIDRGQAIIASVFRGRSGIRAYHCDGENFNLDSPDSESPVLFNAPHGISSIDTGDVDGDGVDEIIVASTEMNERIAIFRPGDSSLGAGRPFYEVSDLIRGEDRRVTAAAGDYDGDGDDEIAVSASAGGDLTYIYDFKNGALASGSPMAVFDGVFGGSGYGAHVASGDFDGDGVDEIVIASDGAGELIEVYSIDGDGSGSDFVDSMSSFFGNITSAVSVAAGDFDLDGRDELAVGAIAPGINVKVFEFKDGAFDLLNPLADIHADSGGILGGTRVFAGDFNGDRQDDLALTVQGKLWVVQYRRGRFIISPPYIDGVEIYTDAPDGMLAVPGGFGK